MGTLVGVIVVSVIFVILILLLTLTQTKKAYDYKHTIDPLPDENNNGREKSETK
ncbi:YtzI protein [Oceanobacillus senegalensis]|uniref:YtzI protein n=1 Tax=Oceanobacillus senegalensis TaxID=1936063 RepID=UPI00117CE475|nr:YtzI protein [Oceanobacillus senegalensis]